MWKLFEHELLTYEGPIEEIIIILKSKGDLLNLVMNNSNKEMYITEKNFRDNRSASIARTVREKQRLRAMSYKGYKNAPAHKFCWSCKKSKHVSEFGVRSRNKDGLSSQCKECTNKKARHRRNE